MVRGVIMKPGEIVARKYLLDRRLGVGGMGEVWRATHTGTGRDFALKFMHAHAAASATARERFAREARASAAVNHPCVIDVFDVGENDEGALYLAMELLDGIALADAFHAAAPLSILELCVVVHDTARALAAAHAAGIIHRDIKPANIFLHKDRATGLASAKVLDFGISKFGGLEDQTQTGAVLGSPHYMSPEQTRSAAAVDPRADIWACGVILFEGLTGTWPHDGDSFSSLVVAICTVPPKSIDALAPSVPEPVRAVVRDCLQPLDRRIGSAGELADRLAAALRDPTLADRFLPRPAHAPSESIKAVSGVRVRPVLSTTASNPGVWGQSSALRRAEPPSSPGFPVAFASLPPSPPRVPSPAALDGTFETLAITTVREPGGAARVSALPVPASNGAGIVPPSPPVQRLRMVLAALAVLFAGIVVALVSVLRSGSSATGEPVAAAASSALLLASAQPAVIVEPLRPPAPAPSASVAPVASSARALAEAPPDAKRTKPASAPARPPPPPPPAGSRVKQLGSGL